MTTLRRTKKHRDVPPPTPNDGVYYPESDGKPVAESEFQYIPATYAASALTAFYAESPDIHVTGNMFIYYKAGDAAMSVAPDIYVTPNLDKRPRISYFMWLEKQVPMFIMEVTSNSIWREATGRKRVLYESWGVPEYWMYDPTKETRLNPLLQGFQPVNGIYEPVEIAVDPDTGLCHGFSPVLNLELHGRQDWFKFFNPSTGEYIANISESLAARLAAEEARLRAEQGRDSEREARLRTERARDNQLARLQEMERLLREHGIDPPR